MAGMARQRTGLPTRQQILDFIEASDTPAGKREIARAFGLSGHDKIALKQMLRDMGHEGLIDSAPGHAFHKMGGVPKVTVLRVVDVDDSGQAWAVPERWESDTPEPRIRLQERGRSGATAVGDRILARTEEKGNGFIAHANHFTLPGMTDFDREEDLLNSRLRQTRVETLIEREWGGLNPCRLRALMSDHANFPRSVCKHHSPESDLDYGTIGSVVIDITDRALWACSGNPCRGEWREVRL